MPYAANLNATPVTATTTAETPCATTPTITVPSGGIYQGMVVRGNLNVNAGTATSVAIRARQGSGTAGTLVGSPLTVACIASVANDVSFQTLDTSAAGASTYTITLTVPVTSVNATVNTSFIEIDPVIAY